VCACVQYVLCLCACVRLCVGVFIFFICVLYMRYVTQYSTHNCVYCTAQYTHYCVYCTAQYTHTQYTHMHTRTTHTYAYCAYVCLYVSYVYSYVYCTCDMSHICMRQLVDTVATEHHIATQCKSLQLTTATRRNIPQADSQNSGDRILHCNSLQLTHCNSLQHTTTHRQ